MHCCPVPGGRPDEHVVKRQLTADFARSACAFWVQSAEAGSRILAPQVTLFDRVRGLKLLRNLSDVVCSGQDALRGSLAARVELCLLLW